MNAKSTVRFIIKYGIVLGKVMIEREVKMNKIWEVWHGLMPSKTVYSPNVQLWEKKALYIWK